MLISGMLRYFGGAWIVWHMIALVGPCLTAGVAYADIYKSVDAEGRITYSNIPTNGAKRIELNSASVGTVRRTSAVPTPSNFPRVDASTQKSRDDVRRKILSQELSSEMSLLAESQETYRNGKPEALPGEQPGGSKYNERAAKIRQLVDLHEKNILALKQELSSLK